MRPVVAMFVALLGAASSVVPQLAGAGGDVVDLGALNSGNYSWAYATTPTGSVVVGMATDGAATNAERAFRWTVGSGIFSLGTLNGGSRSSASGVSADGSVVVGYSRDGSALNRDRAFRWTYAGGMVSLGILAGGYSSRASGVSADGSVVVGRADPVEAGTIPAAPVRAFRWTQATGMVSLGTLNGGIMSYANAVSADGAVVVGYARDGAASNAGRAFRWTQAGGMVSLGTLNGGNSGEATGVNANGTVVVGYADDGAAGYQARAFRWSASSGMVSLGTLPGGTLAMASAVSGNGSVIVGFADGDSAGARAFRAFRWTQAGGMVSVEDWLRANGVNVAPALRLISASGVNGDGSVIVGNMDPGDGSTRAYLARVSGTGDGSTGNGMMSLDQYNESLAGVAPQRAAADRASLVLHGAHNNPLLGLVPTGQSCTWVTGDWARYDADNQAASLGLAEFGVCHRLSSGAQLSATLGGVLGRQDLAFGGSIHQNGGYTLVEATSPIFRPNLWATVTGYYGWGEARIGRGYLNAGMPDASQAHASVPSWAVRARLDWQDALAAGSAGFTPYVDFSYVRAAVESYTETGGSFPARFDARAESATQSRLGVNAIRPLAADVRLLGTLEWVHQFNDQGPSGTGEVVGLFPFFVPGAQYKKDWARAGVGLDAKLGGGTASLMVNVTSQGQDPAYWISASYRIAF